jgi:urocanate hydratase
MAAAAPSTVAALLSELRMGIPLNPLPPAFDFQRDPSVPHAPAALVVLDEEERAQAIANSLRYFPESTHAELAPEFAKELKLYGHVYMYRFRPVSYRMQAYDAREYPAKSRQAAAIMAMIMNNLDPRVAQFPHELVTYGGNGRVFNNWAQFRVTMKYLADMDSEQTLVMYSGHPAGLFPSGPEAPRVVITNGMVIPNYSSKESYERMRALGVSMYGQMTAGSWCYIGPQGIVHGTTITLLNAGRKYLSTSELAGKVYVTSGLGGMSGAQGKAGRICGAIAVIAEVNEAAIKKRHEQGWVDQVHGSLDSLLAAIRAAKSSRSSIALAYHGNVVALWERLVQEHDLTPELGSDQTSLHNPYNGGYYPVQLSFEEANKVMVQDPPRFKQLVQESLIRHVSAINSLAGRGMKFWDYGNAFLLESSRAGADIIAPGSGGKRFRYPSYVEDIMGDIFSLGFGPFRWVCSSCDPADLHLTDTIAAEVIKKLWAEKDLPQVLGQQYQDNHLWITQAEEHRLVVGSQARILYSDARGRVELAVEFNRAVAEGRLKGPVVVSRDHHDVSGTDSPFRETSNITDGSRFCADMAVQNFVGDSFRGATWVALHNGGGVGWGEVINGGFGLVLDGTSQAAARAMNMLSWDVNNGVSRRSWAGNGNARLAITRAMQAEPRLVVTLANSADSQLIQKALEAAKQ